MKLGMVYYVNRINGLTRWDMPASMDTFGACGGLEVLRLNDNLLRELPDSVSLLVRLTALPLPRAFDWPGQCRGIVALTRALTRVCIFSSLLLLLLLRARWLAGGRRRRHRR